MITIYGCPNTRSTRVLWALEEAGVRYDYIKIDLMKGQGGEPAFMAINPGGKVPVLVDGDFVLTESAAICAYVGDTFPDSGLTPQGDPRERAQHDRWCCFVIGELEQPLWTIAKHRFVLPEKRRVPAVVDTAIWEFKGAACVLDEGIADKPFVLGAAFSVADILIAHTLAWAKAFQVPIESERLLGYMDRTLSRPALTRALERGAG